MMQDENLDPKHSSLLGMIAHICHYSIDIVKDIFILFTLEGKLASRSLAVILIVALIILSLLLLSWLSLLGAVVAWLTTLHLNLVMALFLVAGFNILIAIALGLYILRISTNLHFKETRRQLELMRENDETIKSTN
jgi:hypothetical protein